MTNKDESKTKRVIITSIDTWNVSQSRRNGKNNGPPKNDIYRFMFVQVYFRLVFKLLSNIFCGLSFATCIREALKCVYVHILEMRTVVGCLGGELAMKIEKSLTEKKELGSAKDCHKICEEDSMQKKQDTKEKSKHSKKQFTRTGLPIKYIMKDEEEEQQEQEHNRGGGQVQDVAKNAASQVLSEPLHIADEKEEEKKEGEEEEEEEEGNEGK
ncbi:hypothetical protein RFI_16812 [Reticulomyxa filosa]|uniref:Uncharacterized protein n=1 Tax=Reticulomyxa filosa TaxID=46433 RepID=X6N3G6_RETFI|nr:hypothetical protein RFI_16812 [Reticulomyxa filosa]|eukprot:ETO20408.1 hypothetical protein RFI_16812 [Reticulomyxa filosa]